MASLNITFLGTGPAGRIPRPGCNTPCCRDARKPGSRSRRLQSSVLVQTGGKNILFDAGMDLLKQWHRAKAVKRLDGVFISHPHDDAYGGMPRMRKLLEELRQPSATLFIERASLTRAREEFGRLPGLEPEIIRPGKTVRLGSVAVTPLRVEHTFKTTHPTAGFLIRAGKKKIVHVSDVKHIPPESVRAIRNADLFILDCAIYDKNSPTHVNLAQALDIIGKARPKRTLLTQLGKSWPPHSIARRIVKKLNPAADLAYDGMRIKI